MATHNEIKKKIYMRNFIFGVEDSLVSTVGMLAGIAAAGLPKTNIFISSIVLIFVEAISMGIGSYLSEDGSEKNPKKKEQIKGAIIMFCSYFLAGFIPLAPYLLFDIKQALLISIIATLFALFGLGITDATIMKKRIIKNGVKMLILGGAAIGVGMLVGKIAGIN